MSPARSRLPAPNSCHYVWSALFLLLLTIYGALIPLRFEAVPLQQALIRFRHMPLVNPMEAGPRADWVVNMVQYAVLSFCWMAALAVDRSRQRRGWAAVCVLLLGSVVAVGTEFTQIYFPPRTVSANDVVIESAGVILGTSAWLIAGQLFANWLRQFWNRKGLAGLARQCLPAYLSLLLVGHLMPFDFVLGPAELLEKMREGRITLVPFAELAGPGTPMLHLVINPLAFLPVGALLALIPRWSDRGATTLLKIGLAIAMSIELLQLLVYTRHFTMTDVLTGTASILTGWWVVRNWRQKAAAQFGRLFPSRRAGLHLGAWLIAAWTVIILSVSWYPFDFTADPARFVASDGDLSDEDTHVFGIRRMSWMPFVDYYWGSRYQALDQFVRRSLGFAPFGILLALILGPQRRGARIPLISTLGLGIVVECGQYFIPERHPSVTDLVIHVFAAWLGYELTRHVASLLTVAESSRAYEAEAALPAIGPSRESRRAFPNRRQTLLAWFDEKPEWVRVTCVCMAGIGVPCAIFLLLKILGVT